jgi:hypothetical protein
MQRKWAAVRITVNMTDKENQLLERYCEIHQLNKTTAIRQLIKGTQNNAD